MKRHAVLCSNCSLARYASVDDVYKWLPDVFALTLNDLFVVRHWTSRDPPDSQLSLAQLSSAPTWIRTILVTIFALPGPSSIGYLSRLLLPMSSMQKQSHSSVAPHQPRQPSAINVMVAAASQDPSYYSAPLHAVYYGHVAGSQPSVYGHSIPPLSSHLYSSNHYSVVPSSSHQAYNTHGKGDDYHTELHSLPNMHHAPMGGNFMLHYDVHRPSQKPKRKQVKNACVNCQKACKRCDEGRPCSRCIKYGLSATCQDSARKERKRGVKRGPYKRRATMSSATVSVGTVPTSSMTWNGVYNQNDVPMPPPSPTLRLSPGSVHAVYSGHEMVDEPPHSATGTLHRLPVPFVQSVNTSPDRDGPAPTQPPPAERLQPHIRAEQDRNGTQPFYGGPRYSMSIPLSAPASSSTFHPQSYRSSPMYSPYMAHDVQYRVHNDTMATLTNTSNTTISTSSPRTPMNGVPNDYAAVNAPTSASSVDNAKHAQTHSHSIQSTTLNSLSAGTAGIFSNPPHHSTHSFSLHLPQMPRYKHAASARSGVKMESGLEDTYRAQTDTDSSHTMQFFKDDMLIKTEASPVPLAARYQTMSPRTILGEDRPRNVLTRHMANGSEVAEYEAPA